MRSQDGRRWRQLRGHRRRAEGQRQQPRGERPALPPTISPSSAVLDIYEHIVSQFTSVETCGGQPPRGAESALLLLLLLYRPVPWRASGWLLLDAPTGREFHNPSVC
ncbi:unnamed protein product [Lampetra fluviatilis]